MNKSLSEKKLNPPSEFRGTRNGIIFAILSLLFACCIFFMFSGKEAAAQTILTGMPMSNQRTATRFNLSTFEHLRQHQRSLYTSFCPEEPFYEEHDADSTIRGQYAACDPCNPCMSIRGGSLWFQNYGDFLSQQARNGNVGYRMKTYGFSFGYDAVTGPNSMLGVALGGSFTETTTKRQRHKGDTDSFLVALYGGTAYGCLDVLASFGYIHSSLDADQGGSASSTHHGDSLFGGFELSTLFQGATVGCTPFLSYDFIGTDENSLRERSEEERRYAKRDTTSYLQTLGLRFERAYFDACGWLVRPSLSVGWLHDYGKGRIRGSVRFPDGEQYTFSGMPMNKNRFVTSLNVSASLNHQTSLFVRYDGEFCRRFNAQTLHGGIGLLY